MPQLLALSGDDVRRLLPMSRCIDLMADALAGLARQEALNPLRVAYPLPGGGGVFASMPGALASAGGFGAKLISVFPGNRQSGLESHQGLIVLFDAAHGSPSAVVDAASITAIRTAAVSGVATRLLSRTDAADLAILGAGTQARTHLAAMCAVRPIRRVRAWSPTPARLHAFVDDVRSEHDIDVHAASSAHGAVEGATIVCTVTAATQPVLRGAWLAAGVHVNAVGSSVPNAREIDAEAIARAHLFVDRRESALHESGDVLGAMREGAVDERHIRAELGEILIGQAAGRTSDEEITLFESLGLAVEDLAAASFVAEEARSQGVGTLIDM